MNGRDRRRSQFPGRLVVAFVAALLLAIGLAQFPGGGVARANTITIAAQGANHAFALKPGDRLYAGYSFQYPGNNCGVTSNYPPHSACPSPLPLTAFSSISARVDIKCQDGSTPNPSFVTINPPDQVYDGQTGDSGWYPSGTQSSNLTYQGSVAMPDACTSTSNHTMVQGSNMGPFVAEVQTQQDPPPSMQARWHYGPASVLGSNGGTGSSWSATASVTPDLNPNISSASISVTKAAAPASFSGPNQTITYTYTVKNTGSETLTGVHITDDTVTGITCQANQLAAGASTTCTGSYTTTAADVDAEKVTNIATATGTGASAQPVTSDPTTDTVPLAVEALHLDKSVNRDTVGPGGGQVTYTYTITNEGTDPVRVTALADSVIPASEITCTPALPATLQPGGKLTCTAVHTITPAQINDTSTVTNTARATGTDTVTGETVTSNEATATVTLATEALHLTKSVNRDTVGPGGGQVTYTYTVTNEGTDPVQVTGITDNVIPASEITCTPALPATLAPHASLTCHAVHTITPGQINDTSTVTNTAQADGTDTTTGDTITSNEATATVTLATEALHLDKSVTPTTVGPNGGPVTYTYTITNEGTDPVSVTAITDNIVPASEIDCTPDTLPHTLAPGGILTCHATHTITPGEINDTSTVTNTARADGTDTTTGDTVTSNEATATETLATEALHLDKSVTPATVGPAGGQVTYTYTITNEGTDPVSVTAITDTIVPVSEIDCAPDTLPHTLAPGGILTCHATHTITPAQINDTSTVTNTAQADGTDTTTGDTIASNTATAEVTLATEALHLDKSVTPATVGPAGGPVTYTYTITNEGTDPVSVTAITDNIVPASEIDCTPDTLPHTLAPGGILTCHATHTITPGEINDTSTVTNTARADGTDTTTGDTIASNTATAEVTLATEALHLDKSVTPTTVGPGGGPVTYTYTITNEGTDPVSVTAITDTIVPVSEIDCAPDTLPHTLAPGGILTCHATHTITPAQINDTSTVTNTAQADGTDTVTGDTIASNTATATVTVTTAAPALTLTKSVNPGTVGTAGGTVTYTYKVKNTGNIEVTGIGITDNLVNGITCDKTTLEPGQTATCTATYHITAAKISGGSLTNTAEAIGSANGARVTSNGATATVKTRKPVAPIAPIIPRPVPVTG